MNSHHTAMNVYCIIHCRVLLMSGTAVMGVQCEKEGVEHTALGDLRTKVWPTIPNRLGSVFEEYVFPTPLTAHFCVCVSMLEWVSSEMQMRGEDGIMACWRQPSICALNMRTSSFADVKTYSSCQQTGWKGGGAICHTGLSTVPCRFIIGSRASLDICMRVKLCSRHQVSSAGFILGSIDRWSKSLWLWKGAGEEQVQEETLFDAGAEGMTWNGKSRHSGIYGIELWVVEHEKQVKDNTVCWRGMHFQPRWDEFRVISHHIYIYTQLWTVQRERAGQSSWLFRKWGKGVQGCFSGQVRCD